jgi:hypothetical protein
MIEREIVYSEDNDPDTLQLLGELDSDWVECWRKAANKKRSAERKLSFKVILPQKTIKKRTRLQSEKTDRKCQF